MRTKRMLRRGLTALAAALAIMTALAAPAFAYAGDSADSTAETLHSSPPPVRLPFRQRKSGGDNQRRRLNLRDGASLLQHR